MVKNRLQRFLTSKLQFYIFSLGYLKIMYADKMAIENYPKASIFNYK